MFLGIFITLTGVLALAEAIGLVSTETKWGLPLAVTCFGASLIWDAWQSKLKPISDNQQ